MILRTFGAFITALSFAILFNTKNKNIVISAIGGAIGFVIYEILIQYTSNVYFVAFVSSMAFSLYSEIMARKFKSPVINYLVISLIILVPGKGMYDTMLAVVLGDTALAFKNGLNTITVALALAFGVIFASTIVKTYYKLKQRRKIQKQ